MSTHEIVTQLFVLFLSILVVVNGDFPPKSFDVIKYGAVANGKTDNSQVSFRDSTMSEL